MVLIIWNFWCALFEKPRVGSIVRALGMIWLLVLVVVGAAAIFGPGWVEAHEQNTLADLLEQIATENYQERNVSVKTGKDESYIESAFDLFLFLWW